VNTILKSKLP